MSPQASNSRRWLNQSTYSKVAISTCFDGPRWATGFDQFGLEQSDHGLGQGVVERVADRTDRRIDPDLGETLGERDRCVLRPGVVVVDQPTAPIAAHWES